MDEALRIREFWFGRALTGAQPGQGEKASLAHLLTQRCNVWFAGESAQRLQRDELIRGAFQEVLERAASGALASWADSPRRRLSLILLLDQFPRQCFRGTARAFAYDQQALALTMTGMQGAADGALNTIERIFFYMPLQHAESLEAQEESVAAYKRLSEEVSEELRARYEGFLGYAQAHRELIRQFGRFPHRNKVLGRANTPEEQAYLSAHPDSFGQ